jgi:hypothetical protein
MLGWLASSVVGSAIVSAASWAAFNYRLGYPLLFNASFSTTVGAFLGILLAAASAVLDRRKQPVWRIQAVAFPIALIVALMCTIASHILGAILPAIVTYLATVWAVSGSERASRSYYACECCGYDLRGSLEIGRCPECGMAFDARQFQAEDDQLGKGDGSSY